ncbi:unnamed protein product [Parnassius apollo]|uniref:(apollo) hypothetical protein n=1 Tax=Parnassius apollo TaxID=110799 RepID=A0A8S3XFE3_PARAO|nr:unnamed protein product [Parnassius apollo]
MRRCRRERAVREVLQCFKQAFLRPRRTLIMSVAAAYNSRSENSSDGDVGITDDEMEGLLTELETAKNMLKSTLQCKSCGKRLVIGKKQATVQYCDCKDGHPAEESIDGWVPFMEAEDVIIWRKEYKTGQGLYAYKVYGRYPEVNARDFAAVQLDGAYRRAWDAAVAALAVVQRSAKGVQGQTILHWEVLWPRLFANRDYVYIRRHKEFDVHNEPLTRTDKTNVDSNVCTLNPNETPSVHAKAKRKAMENYEKEREDSRTEFVDNKVYIIVSRSCEHPDVPETKHAIRVVEYWSHMVVKTLEGADKAGMEFVLTYYDEPAVGGLPGGVAAWASGRAAPAYLERMRAAAQRYRHWSQQEMPDFTPLDPDLVNNQKEKTVEQINEEDMESSKEGPEMENAESKSDKSTQTEEINKTEVEECKQKVEGDDIADAEGKNNINEAEAKTIEVRNEITNDREKKEVIEDKIGENTREQCEMAKAKSRTSTEM